MFLFVCFQFCFILFFLKIKKKNGKSKEKKNKKQKQCVFVYIGSCVPWMAIETKFSKLCIFYSLDEYLYA